VRRSRLCLLALLAIVSRAGAQRVDTTWVDVDGHRMHLLVSGRANSPTIVLEAGGGSSHRSWGTLPARLSELGRVVAYDRPGFGKSELCTKPRTADVIAQELRAALRSAGIAPPYLLVGWSLGGALIRVFAGMYASDVAGLVLVDPVSEDFYDRAEREMPAIFRRLDSLDVQSANDGPPAQRAEDAAFDSILVQARRSDGAFTGPAIVLGSPRTDLEGLGAIWNDEQRKWATRRSRGEFVIVEGTGHAIHRDRPDVVVDAVRRMKAIAPPPR
jgi:pimeloyl-ACP methyl ester carboxylesterase